MSNDTNENEKTSIRDRIKTRYQTTKAFVGRHKSAFVVGAVTTPVMVFMAKQAAAANECCETLDAIDAELSEELDSDESDIDETV